MKIKVIDNNTGIEVDGRIEKVTNHKVPGLKDNWNFDWNKLKNEDDVIIYRLSVINNEVTTIEGMLMLKQAYGMLIMDLLEIAPHNVGTGIKKRYKLIAESLIAFACRESFKVGGDFQGYLTFIAKSDLVNTYKTKYGAKEENNRKMYIDDINGTKLIEKYLS